MLSIESYKIEYNIIYFKLSLINKKKNIKSFERKHYYLLFIVISFKSSKIVFNKRLKYNFGFFNFLNPSFWSP